MDKPAYPGPIFLVGMPGAGKTYWGQQLSDYLHIPFTDLDEYIAQQEGATISGLFEAYNEHGFREIEHKHLVALIESHTENCVIACGGGTPCFLGNVTLMKMAGTVVYLEAQIETLVQNLATSADNRPLLQGQDDLPGYVRALLAQREPFYLQAHHILPVEQLSVTTFAQILANE